MRRRRHRGHRRGKRVCAHARSAESVKMCVRSHVDVIPPPDQHELLSTSTDAVVQQRP